VILEPAGAAWGTVPMPTDFVGAVRERTRDLGTLLVFDEVVTGFRWSPGGVQALIGVEPADVDGYPSLHSDKYDFTDAALGVAMRMFGEIVMNWSGGR